MTLPNIADLADFLDSISFLFVLVLILIQILVVLIAPPEKAEKLNYLGKLLEYLVKVRLTGGCDDKKDT